MKFRAWDKSNRIMCKVIALRFSEVQPEMPIGCLEDYAIVIGNVWENPDLIPSLN